MSESFDFLFAELEEGKPVEVLRVGEFVDRSGRPVTVTDEDLDAFVANFEANAAGQEVPIDVNHERGEAAGWIQSLTRAGDTLTGVPDWNELGVRLVGERVYRYLSATIDLAKKVIKSVSLVNFPAVKGLRPVELAEGVYGLEEEPGLLERVMAAVKAAFESENKGGDEDETDVAEFVIRKEGSEIVLYSKDGEKVLGRFPFGPGTEYSDEDAARAAAAEREKEIERIKYTKEASEMLTDEEKAELREKLREEILAELAEKQKTEVELREQVRAEVVVEFKEQIEAEMAERYERRQKLVEFAEKLCGGEAGLSAKPEDVVAVLEALPEDQVETVQALLEGKVVDFGERGSSRDGEGEKKELPQEFTAHLSEWVEAGFEVADFFEDLDMDPDEYDLSEFEKEENDG